MRFDPGPVPVEERAELRRVLLAAVRARFGWPELRVSQDESLQVVAVEAGLVRFVWTVDHDFCSQYDQTESWSGSLEGGQVRWDGRGAPADGLPPRAPTAR